MMNKKDYKKSCFIALVNALVSLFLAFSIGKASIVSLLLQTVSIFYFITAIIYAVRWAKQVQDSKYDLSKLFDDPTTDEAIDDEDPKDKKYIYCINCGAGYPADLPACPDCGKLNRLF